MMIISENMNCWPREGANNIDVNCPISLIAGDSPTRPNNANVASTSISAALDSDTSPLSKYLPSSPHPAFPGIHQNSYGYDNDNNINFTLPCTGSSAGSPYSGVNLTIRSTNHALIEKIFNTLNTRFDATVPGPPARCGKIRYYPNGSNHSVVYYSLANYRNQIEF